ncbi:ABC transporter substrate-binding protein [Vagococcus fluvialis]|uniref:ABC transporter substrate-binding protein n=1 Tax=Vagococcus fluvialis TaxID=2738 RepID=UPI001A8D90F8|nr:extracellular solute-binding protein [Vagococcus fluvialis]MBO0443754.1 extracellular solute-binding protein [Vagococcus fluvialis]
MKKSVKFLLGMVLVASLFVVASCGKKEGADKKEDGKITIRLLTRMTGTSPQVLVYKETLDQFAKDYPEVEIVDDSQGDEGAFNNILKTSRASNDLPNIYRVQGVANLGEYIDNNLIMNMDDAFKEDKEWGDGFVEGALSYYNVPGYEGTYGIPIESGLIGIYYNKELFEKAGIPKFPETWNEFEDAIVKLNKIDVTPIALGAKANYTAGHLHNLIFYRMLGTQKAKDLGDRKAKWTDKDVVETLDVVKQLTDMKAFDENAVGIDDQIALTSFFNGESAMVITGPWNIPHFYNEEKTKLGDTIDFAKFPYFDGKEEFKDEDMQVISPLQIRGDLEGREKKLTLELAKRLSNAEIAKKYADEANQIFPRTDYEVDPEKATKLFLKNSDLAKTSTGIAVDVFDYDPVQSMQDVTRNALVGILQGGSPEEAAETIQREIDNNAK